MNSIQRSLPDLRLKNQDNNWIRLHDFVGHPMVIYFYPKDDTFGCTREACAFRDHSPEFEQINARVFGISADSVESHRAFHTKYQLNFDLLSDPDGLAINAFEVPLLLGLRPRRATFVVDKSGMIRFTWSSEIQWRKHVTQALEVIEAK